MTVIQYKTSLGWKVHFIAGKATTEDVTSNASSTGCSGSSLGELASIYVHIHIILNDR